MSDKEYFDKRMRQMKFFLGILIGWIIGTGIYTIITRDFLGGTLSSCIGIFVGILGIFYMKFVLQPIKKSLGDK